MLKFSSTAVAVACLFFISYDFTCSTHLTSDFFSFNNKSFEEIIAQYGHKNKKYFKVDIDKLHICQEVLYIFFYVNVVTSPFR